MIVDPLMIVLVSVTIKYIMFKIVRIFVGIWFIGNYQFKFHPWILQQDM